MRYVSTRYSKEHIRGTEAVVRGLSREGGLFVPETLPEIRFEPMLGMNYRQAAVYIMNRFFDDFTTAELADMVDRAYSPKAFDTPEIAPLHELDRDTYFLELWHGPTCAFKDIALQLLPRLLTASMEKTGAKENVCILTATSGDTGKAALEGFADVDRTKIMVFYPENGVSDIQKLQMASQSGGNVSVVAVKGNFDDAQTAVKRIFSDAELSARLRGRGWTLSSANSINWGRLLPQIVYYYTAYCGLVKCGAVKSGENVNFCVPTGNFGDILAGFYAKSMGLPIKKLICASNSNNVLTEFINTGVYDKNRPFYTTISPSMDILVSSNLERLLYHLSGSDAETAGYMARLGSEGRYKVSDDIFDRIQALFASGCCDDARTSQVIGDTFKENGCLIDTHTAVAYGALKDHRNRTGDGTVTVVVSTASPFKFCASVLEAIGSPSDIKGPEIINALERETGVPAPAPLKALLGKTARFTDVMETSELIGAVESFLA